VINLLEGSNPSPSAMSENDLTQAELLELGAATLGESGGHAMRARIRPAWPGARLASPAFPVHCTPGDNLAIHVAVAEAPEGSALVVNVGDQHELGYWGEVLTTGAQARGLAGLVIDGGVRDVTALEAHHFPVFSTMIALRGATKEKRGTVGDMVTVGDIEVHQGDWVIGDADGVTVVSAAALPEVLAAGRARAAKEEGYFSALRSGATTMSLLGLNGAPVTRA
jgi:4-hydroxy-4-methyl-2-oxoglutarate aldolase